MSGDQDQGEVRIVRLRAEQAVELFSSTSENFSGAGAMLAAQQLAQSQPILHREFFQRISGDAPTKVSSFVQQYIIENIQPNSFGIDGTTLNESSVICEELPIILNETINKAVKLMSSATTQMRKYETFDLIFAAYMSRTRFVGDVAAIFENNPSYFTRFSSAIAQVESVHVAGITGARNSGLIGFATNKAVEEARGTFGAATAALETEVARLQERTDIANESSRVAVDKLAALQASTDAAEAKVDSLELDFAEKFDASSAKVAAFMESLRAEANFDDLKIHWVDRGRKAGWALFWSSLVLLLLLVALPAYAIANSDGVIVFLKHLTDVATAEIGPNASPVTVAVSTVSRLVVITIPLALYFWLIRLVVRFNMRSMLLMDDARQRATMLETYYRMIEKSAATREDRALVLQALMRPAPGHGPDSIEPPNFTEVIDKAMGK